MKRLGLSECLEDYAARIGATPNDARFAWRAQGLAMLGGTFLRDGLCLIGGPVHVGPEIAEVLADD